MRAQEIIDTTPLTVEDLRVLDRMDGELAPLARELLTDIDGLRLDGPVETDDSKNESSESERNGGTTVVGGSA